MRQKATSHRVRSNGGFHSQRLLTSRRYVTSAPFTRQTPHRETCLTCTASTIHRRCQLCTSPRHRRWVEAARADQRAFVIYGVIYARNGACRLEGLAATRWPTLPVRLPCQLLSLLPWRRRQRCKQMTPEPQARGCSGLPKGVGRVIKSARY